MPVKPNAAAPGCHIAYACFRERGEREGGGEDDAARRGDAPHARAAQPQVRRDALDAPGSRRRRGERGRARERMAELAARFPGALREIDDLELGIIRDRIGQLEAVLHGGGRVERWMEAVGLFHALARGALRAKRWLAGRKTVGPATVLDYESEFAEVHLATTSPGRTLAERRLRRTRSPGRASSLASRRRRGSDHGPRVRSRRPRPWHDRARGPTPGLWHASPVSPVVRQTEPEQVAARENRASCRSSAKSTAWTTASWPPGLPPALLSTRSSIPSCRLRQTRWRWSVRFRGLLGGLLGLLRRRIEVGIPAATLEDEIRSAADQPVRGGLGALRAHLDGRLDDALHLFPLMPARPASVLVGRHTLSEYGLAGTVSSEVPDR